MQAEGSAAPLQLVAFRDGRRALGSGRIDDLNARMKLFWNQVFVSHRCKSSGTQSGRADNARDFTFSAAPQHGFIAGNSDLPGPAEMDDRSIASTVVELKQTPRIVQRRPLNQPAADAVASE